MKHSQKVAREWKTQGDGIKGETVQIYVSAISLCAACLLREIKILALIFSVFCVFFNNSCLKQHPVVQEFKLNLRRFEDRRLEWEEGLWTGECEVKDIWK